MDPLIAGAAQALGMGDPLAALKRVALRQDPPALALRGIAMAQLGDLDRAKALLRRAARAFGPRDITARARCLIAEAEIALVSRDLAGAARALGAGRAALAAHSDPANAAHAGYLEARRLLLIGHLDAAEAALSALDPTALPRASRAGYWLVAAGIAMRRIRAGPARAALRRAMRAAGEAGIPALTAEVESASRALGAPAARLLARDGQSLVDLAEVEALIASGALVADAGRAALREGPVVVPLAGRPVLFALVRALAEAWPEDLSREALILRAFRARQADESHRARLRVEIGRLRVALRPLAGVNATRRGFVLKPHRAPRVILLARPAEGEHAAVLALLADGEAWSSSALALALGTSPRSIQRALEVLAASGRAEAVGAGRARRWVAPSVPGFPTVLLLPAPLAGA